MSRASVEQDAKISADHLERMAYVYVRQSSPRQVQEHLESQRRQYELVEWALARGWPREAIQVIDEDQGKSSATAKTRPGFARLLAAVGRGAGRDRDRLGGDTAGAQQPRLASPHLPVSVHRHAHRRRTHGVRSGAVGRSHGIGHPWADGRAGAGELDRAHGQRALAQGRAWRIAHHPATGL